MNAECPPRTPEWIAQQLHTHGTDLLVLSGGEPLIHARTTALRDLLGNLTAMSVHVETNGTLTPPPWLVQRVEHFTVSPKLAHGGDPEGRRIKAGALGAFAELALDGGAVMKVVVQDESDCWQAKALHREHGWPAGTLWLMPEGITADAVLATARELADTVLEVGAYLTLRQHTLLYGTERGR